MTNKSLKDEEIIKALECCSEPFNECEGCPLYDDYPSCEIYIIELIKDELSKKNILINSVELDYLIWWMGKKNKDRKSIAHHTITIFY